MFRCPVGITHNRHDRRLIDHQLAGGHVVDTVRVPDRAAALRVETWVKAMYAPWSQSGVGPAEFPQGGWTETWAEAGAPPLDLEAAVAAAGVVLCR